MGYMRHHAIVITGPFEGSATRFYTKPSICEVRERVAEFAQDICEVTEPTRRALNGYSSFLIAPDGSKEGWAESDAGDLVRDKIIEYLNSLRFDDGSTLFDFVEVQFGDDNKETKAVRHSDEKVPA